MIIARQNDRICVVEGDRLINQLALYLTKRWNKLWLIYNQINICRFIILIFLYNITVLLSTFCRWEILKIRIKYRLVFANVILISWYSLYYNYSLLKDLKGLKNSSSIFGMELEKHLNASKSDVPFIVTKCIKEVETHGLYVKVNS